jgi:FixJ family two-component response regulator
MPERPGLVVHVVDDDASIRDSIGLLLGLRGYRCAQFASAEDFLSALRDDWQGCVLADLRLPGLDGLALQSELKRRGVSLPVVIITGHGDVASARAAFQAEAVDFLEKPFDENSVIRAIESAFLRETARLEAHAADAQRTAMLKRLTTREHEIAMLLASGLHNRAIAMKLAISPRTVEVHKARIMEKLGAASVADLIRLTTSRSATP